MQGFTAFTWQQRKWTTKMPRNLVVSKTSPNPQVISKHSHDNYPTLVYYCPSEDNSEKGVESLIDVDVTSDRCGRLSSVLNITNGTYVKAVFNIKKNKNPRGLYASIAAFLDVVGLSREDEYEYISRPRDLTDLYISTIMICVCSPYSNMDSCWVMCVCIDDRRDKKSTASSSILFLSSDLSPQIANYIYYSIRAILGTFHQHLFALSCGTALLGCSL